MAVAVAVAVAVAAMAGAAPSAAAGPRSAAVPRYDHIFVVVEENHGFADVIGNPAARGPSWTTPGRGASGNNETLILRGDANGFEVVNGPDPGSGSNIPGGVAAIGDTVRAVGQFDDGANRLTLIERHREP